MHAYFFVRQHKCITASQFFTSWNGNACCWQFFASSWTSHFHFPLRLPVSFHMLLATGMLINANFCSCFLAELWQWRWPTSHWMEWMTQFPSEITSIDLNEPEIDSLPSWQISPIWIIYAHQGKLTVAFPIRSDIFFFHERSKNGACY